MRKIAVVGSRKGFTKDTVYRKLRELKLSHTDTIITGGAPGVDTLAISFCQEYDVKCEIIRPINPSNKIDYLFRNVEIISLSDKMLVFWDQESKGTKFTLEYAKARNKSIDLYTTHLNKTLEEFK